MGIGGAGMSGIAEVLANLGFQVSGSDLVESEATRRLRRRRIRIFLGHSPENLGSCQAVVYSSAVSPDNPEVAEARRRRLPVLPRAEMLAELMRLKRAVCIAGTHGKTTTTSLTAWVLAAGGLDPTAVIGGRFANLRGGVRHGRGLYFVAEADESDGSFLLYSPSIAVITNIDDDHLDHYGTPEKIADAFVRFANRVPFYGCVIADGEDPGFQAVRSRLRRRVVTYGLNSGDLVARRMRLSPGGSSFEAEWEGRPLGPARLSVPGEHNVRNALAATAVGLLLGVSFGKIRRALATFRGVKRRLEKIGEAGGVAFLDDYGHHPTEIRAALAAVRRMFPGRRLWVLFQPHRYSRTQLLAEKFGSCFEEADGVEVLPIYPAGEKEIPGVSHRLIEEAIRSRSPQRLLTSSNGEPAVPARLKPGDVLLTLGAGDVWKIGRRILEARRAVSR